MMLQEQGGVPASSGLLALLGLGITELWGSKILSSLTQAFGGGCSWGKGATWLSGFPVKHLGSFAQLSHYQTSAGLGRLWVLGNIPRKHHSPQLSPPRVPAWCPAEPLAVPCSVCLLTPLPIPVWFSAA